MNTSVLPLAERFEEAIQDLDPIRFNGLVSKVIGLLIEASGPQASLGEQCWIILDRKKSPQGSRHRIPAEVVGFRDKNILLMALGDMAGIYPGCEVIATGHPLRVKVGEKLKGRILNGLGEPMDGKGPLDCMDTYPILNAPPDPLQRPRIEKILPLGIKAIDGCLTVGKGQRIGIFAGSGVGKSTLLGMMARYTSADVNVIALIGERGREVKDFIEKELGEEGLRKSILVVATSDQAPLVRMRGAFVATAIAEFFRDRGNDVLLLMDSVTRFARSQREIGLATGEAPAQRGFTPSVFSTLPRLLERAGTSHLGSITGLYTVLVDADDFNEPISDTVRGILDGHIILSRDLAHRGHYPAIDILESISRLMTDISGEEQKNLSTQLKKMMAIYRQSEDLINIGAYVKGSNPEIDMAVQLRPRIDAFLQQNIQEFASFSDVLQKLKAVFS